MAFLKEFKDFALKGSLIDIAVGFVMGAAFKQVVSSFTGGIVSPLIGMIFKTNFKNLKYVIKEAGVNNANEKVAEIAILYGDFLTQLIDFIIVAFVMFLVVKGFNKAKRKKEPTPEKPSGPTQEELLIEIRDLLKK